MRKLFNLMGSPSPQEQAKRDLRKAHIQLLEAEANAEYWKGLSTILRMSVKRLEAYTNKETT